MHRSRKPPTQTQMSDEHARDIPRSSAAACCRPCVAWSTSTSRSELQTGCTSAYKGARSLSKSTRQGASESGREKRAVDTTRPRLQSPPSPAPAPKLKPRPHLEKVRETSHDRRDVARLARRFELHQERCRRSADVHACGKHASHARGSATTETRPALTRMQVGELLNIGEDGIHIRRLQAQLNTDDART